MVNQPSVVSDFQEVGFVFVRQTLLTLLPAFSYPPGLFFNGMGRPYLKISIGVNHVDVFQEIPLVMVRSRPI